MNPPDPASVLASLLIRERGWALAQAVCERDPTTASAEEARCHFAFLAQALEFGRPALFAAYAAWLKPMLMHRGVAQARVASHLQFMAETLEAQLPAAAAQAALACVREALAGLAAAPASLDDLLGQVPQQSKAYLAHLLAGDTQGAQQYALAQLHGADGARELYLQVLAPAMHEVGRLWQAGRVTVAHEHYCTGVTQGVLAQVGASLPRPAGRRTAVVACVAGDEHGLGSRMVADFLEMAGWRTAWLGANMPGGDLLRIVAERRADLLALSCTYAPQLHDVASLVGAVRALPELRNVKVIVGGHAFGWCEDLWRDVGADAYAADAAQAADEAQRLVPQ